MLKFNRSSITLTFLFINNVLFNFSFLRKEIVLFNTPQQLLHYPQFRYEIWFLPRCFLATARLLHNLLDRIVVEWVGWDFIQVSPKFHYIFHHPTAATSLIFTDQLSWVCLSLSVCLCVSMLSVVCHAYRNNLIRLRWLACSVRRRHPPPAGDEQTFIINKEDYLIKPCSLQLSISLLVVTVPVLVIWIRWGQVVTCSGPTGPIHAGKLNVDYIGLKSANHLKSFIQWDSSGYKLYWLLTAEKETAKQIL